MTRKKLANFFAEPIYIGILALITIFCWMFELETIGLLIFGSLAVFLLIFLTDTSPLLPIIMFVCVLFSKPANEVKIDAIVYIMAPFIVLSLAYYLFKNKKKYILGKYFYGLLLGAIGLSLGGLFFDFIFAHFLTVSVMSLLVVASYLFFYNTATNLKKVTLNSFIGIIVVLLVQLTFYYCFVEDFKLAFNYKTIHLGWGNSNNIGVVLSMLMPITFYKIVTSKYSPVFVLLACLNYIGILMTLSRGNMLFGGLFFVPLLIVSFIHTKQKMNMLLALIFFAILVVLVISVFDNIYEVIKEKFFNLTLDDNGRFELFYEAFDDLKLNVIFGVGFYHNYDVIPHWYHNTLLQIIGSLGIVGTVLFVPFFIQRYFVAVKKFNLCNFFMLCSIALSALYGLIDCNFFFIYNALFTIFIYIIIEREEDTINLFKFITKKAT